MRIVFDTNVLSRVVTGPNGPAAAAFHLVRPPHLIVASTYLLDETAKALRYPRLRQLHRLDDAGIDAFVQRVQRAAFMAAIPHAAVIPVVTADPDDDAIVATAVLGRADVLCTRDKHLRGTVVVQHCLSHGIEVLTDLELLARLRPSTTP